MNESRTWMFRYQLPKPLHERTQPLTVEKVQKELSTRSQAEDGKSLDALWHLVQLYTRRTGTPNNLGKMSH
jgi:hypothetical protein